MNVGFDEDGWNDYLYWQTADRKILKRINRLIEDITRDDPFTGIGQPEQLRANLSGLWSRRITEEHRLVYGVDEADNLVILQARFHY